MVLVDLFPLLILGCHLCPEFLVPLFGLSPLLDLQIQMVQEDLSLQLVLLDQVHLLIRDYQDHQIRLVVLLLHVNQLDQLVQKVRWVQRVLVIPGHLVYQQFLTLPVVLHLL